MQACRGLPEWTAFGRAAPRAAHCSKVKELLQRDGVIDRLGENRVYGNVYEAAADQIPDDVVPQVDSD
jgi:hypothetical protein